MNNVTLLINSCMQPDSVIRLISSIRYYYEHLPIIVVEDSTSKERYLGFNNVQIFHIPHSKGIAPSRNCGISKVKTEYVVVLNEYFEFSEETIIEELLAIISASDLDVLGGQVYFTSDDSSNRTPVTFYGNLNSDILVRTLSHDTTSEKTDDYITCKAMPNFFIAKTSKLLEHPWDESQAVPDHSACYLEHSDRLKIGFTRRVSINTEYRFAGGYISCVVANSEIFIGWLSDTYFKSTKKLSKKNVREQLDRRRTSIGSKVYR
jgi:glycosyltransferase involved in cell wall biosynthesis